MHAGKYRFRIKKILLLSKELISLENKTILESLILYSERDMGLNIIYFANIMKCMDEFP